MDAACVLKKKQKTGMKIMYIFMKVRRRKIKDDRKNKLIKHIFALFLYYSLSFSQKFSRSLDCILSPS